MDQHSASMRFELDWQNWGIRPKVQINCKIYLFHDESQLQLAYACTDPKFFFFALCEIAHVAQSAAGIAKSV